MPDRVARQKRDGLSTVGRRIDREQRPALGGGQNAARLAEHGGGAGDVPERGVVIVHEGKAPAAT